MQEMWQIFLYHLRLQPFSCKDFFATEPDSGLFVDTARSLDNLSELINSAGEFSLLVHALREWICRCLDFVAFECI